MILVYTPLPCRCPWHPGLVNARGAAAACQALAHGGLCGSLVHGRHQCSLAKAAAVMADEQMKVRMYKGNMPLTIPILG